MKQKRLNDYEKIELTQLWDSKNWTIKQLSEKYCITTVAIIGLLKRRGYTMKPQTELQRKYPINETFFDTIDTQEKAYILGLLYADGYNNTGRNSVNLALKESDKEILDKITAIIQPTKPLQYVDTSSTSTRKSKGFENSQNQYRLVIANKHISEQLSKLGCTKAKTFSIIFPTEEQVPSYLHSHFIRGYFDGDGSVSGNKQKQFSITGTELFLRSIQAILVKELNFSNTKLDRRNKNSTNNILSLRYCGILRCIKFRDYLYKDSTISLFRKEDIFKSYKSL